MEIISLHSTLNCPLLPVRLPTYTDLGDETQPSSQPLNLPGYNKGKEKQEVEVLGPEKIKYVSALRPHQGKTRLKK